MSSLYLPPAVVEALWDGVRRAFPEEGCGLILGEEARPSSLEVVVLPNEQTRLHQADPEVYPRDGRTAYFMNPLKVARLVEQAEERGGGLVAIFHSHPGHPSYFSQTDRAAAMPFGVPTWPRAWQIVISVFDGHVCQARAFLWDGADFIEGTLTGLPPLPGPPAGAAPLAAV